MELADLACRHMIVQGLPDVKEVEDEWDIVLCEGGCWSDTRREDQ
jgi:hypothetical protein